MREGEQAMAKTRSFASIIWNKYSGEIENAVFGYIEENLSRLELGSRYAREPDEAELAELNLHRVIARDAPGTRVSFDVIAIAEIEVYHTSHSEAMESSAQKWFRVSCEAELSGGFKNFAIKSIDEYDNNDNKTRDLMTDTLVPLIYAADLEKHAEAILSDVYPEALDAPVAVDVREFARRLGLTVEERRLSRGATIFGEMIFADCKADYYDDSARRYVSFDAAAGTILVDPEIYFLRTLGSWNNTVIHECVHWIKHRRVFELERLYDEKVSRIRCKVAESATDEQKRSATEWMEWHANALSPRILMPRRTFTRKADEIISWHKRENNTGRLGDVISPVINDLADFFSVSVQAAKIRMIDIGYIEAIGAYEYVDDRYVSSYSFADGAIGRNQTFSVPAIDGLVQYAFNADFRKLIDSGGFVHTDSHYCINSPKYITQNEHGIAEMTEYAKRHIDECCLVFERRVKPNTAFGARRYTECALFQSAVSKTLTEIEYDHTDRNKETAERAAALRAEMLEVKEASKIAGELPGSFCHSLKRLMEWRGITVEKLAERALLSPKTIQRMRNDAEREWKLDHVAAVCVGLRLPSNISVPLIEKAGYKLRGEKGSVLNHLLATRCGCPIQEFNECLEAAGHPPLSGEE
jgi:DNA-binding Xre family transcriptional regulator